MRTLLLLSALVTGLLSSVHAAPDPYHSFCSSLWLFETPCPGISAALAKQVVAFSPLKGCEKCQYQLLSVTPVRIRANHTSPDSQQTQNITFDLSPTAMSGGCRVFALSMSVSFTSLLDGGLNYCNLYDLLSASDLNAAPGFTEIISEWACLGYKLATCAA